MSGRHRIALCLVGGHGRLGQSIAALLSDGGQLQLHSVLTSGRKAQIRSSPEHAGGRGLLAAGKPTAASATAQVTADMGAALSGAQLAIDVSAPSACARLAPACARRGLPLLVAASALTPAARRALGRAAAQAPVMWAANLSPQVAVMMALAQQIGPALAAAGAPADVGLSEVHHRHKRDAPSATALRLAQAVGLKPKAVVAQRLGEIAGEHTLTWAAGGEQLLLQHRCADHQVFARGALAAGQWLCQQPPGLYGVADWLGLRPGLPAARGGRR